MMLIIPAGGGRAPIVILFQGGWTKLTRLAVVERSVATSAK